MFSDLKKILQELVAIRLLLVEIRDKITPAPPMV